MNLMIAGFNPYKSILSLMPNLKNIYCDDSTLYVHCESEEEKLFEELVRNKRPYKYFLIKHLEYFEYWKDENITFDIKKLYGIEEREKLDNFYLGRVKEF
jgi:hypothetical protein